MKTTQTILNPTNLLPNQIRNILTYIIAEPTEETYPTTQGIITIHLNYNEDSNSSQTTHITYNKRTIKYKPNKTKPTPKLKETKPMYTKSQLTKLRKADLIQIILDNQFQIPQPTKETSPQIQIITPKLKPIDPIETTTQPKPTINYQSFKPTIEQTKFIAKATISHPDLFTTHYPKPNQATSLENYQHLITNKPLHISLINYLTKQPKKQTLNMNHLQYKKTQELNTIINNLPTNTDFIYLDKTFQSPAALKAHIQHNRIIYITAKELNKQFPQLSIKALETKMQQSDKSPQQYKQSVLDLIKLKSKTFADCPVNLFKQHLAEYKLYLQNLNQA